MLTSVDVSSEVSATGALVVWSLLEDVACGAGAVDVVSGVATGATAGTLASDA